MKNNGSKKSTEESISQLLWAARGRTPHFYKSRPWGLTIPTWAGEQNISSVYLISDFKLSKYVNWHKNRPTHSLLEVARIDKQIFDKFSRSYSPNDRFIVLGKNEDFQRSLWKVGYQLLNLLLQASVLNINYRVFLLDTSQKVILQDIGIKAPVAILAL